jgi:hypothetical protein
MIFDCAAFVGFQMMMKGSMPSVSQAKDGDDERAVKR